MNCPRCQHDNPSHAKFCLECGAALTVAEPRGMRPLVAHCHLGLGKLYRRAGNRREALEHLTMATAMYKKWV